MPRPKEESPLTVLCPHCSRRGEPDLHELTGRYVCPVCGSPLDAQVFIEKKKRGIK